MGVPPVAMSMVSGHMPSVNGGVSDKVVIEPTGAAEIPAWFQPVMERVISAVHNCGVQTTDDQRHTFAESGHAHMQRQLLDAVSLPKSTLMSYSGDPSSYWVFVNAFDSSVGNLAVDDSVKLSRLIECCTGKAAKVIRPCALMVPAEGYVRARQLLAERFGSEFLVSEACINKVVTGPPVRPNNGEALQEFTDELRCCVETLNAMGRLNEVEDRSRMVALVQRLPLYIQGRWRKEAVHTLDRIGRYPGVQQLVTFLDKVSREVNDPVFGPLEFKGKKDVKPQKMTGSRSFNVVADNKGRKSGGSAGPKSGHSGGTDYKAKSPLSCLVCQGSHMLSSCKKFQGLDPVKRFEVVKQKRLCFLCLEGTGHGAYQCPKAGNCSVGSCNGKHHMLLHEVLGKAKAKVTQARDEGPKGQDQSAELQSKCYSNSCKSSQSGKGRVGLPIVPVKIRGVGGDKCIVVHALLDPGSNRSFCSQALMLQLGLEGRSTQVSLETLSATGETEAIEIALEASSCTGRQCKKKVVVLPGVLALKKFPDLGGSCIAVSDVKCYEHLNDLPLKSVSSSGIHLIVGQDVPHALMPLEVRYGAEGEPYGVRTALGWTVSGPVSGGESEPEVAISHYVQVAPQSVADTELSTQVERFWKIDVGQELAGGSLAASLEDRRALKVWDESVQRHEGHYVLDMPLRSESTDWPSEASKVTAERRLSSLKKRLMRDSDYHAKYNTEMQKLLDKGYAEPVPVSESVCQDGPSWYLPHHNVKNPNKPEKFRVVFDCAAQSGGTSLNKEVLQGPDMTNKLVGVLTRFRQHPVAIMADIEAMFYQVKVSMHHRNALKFLWWEDGDLEKVPQVYRMAVHLFGGVWSPSCAAYALRRTAQDHASKYHPETVKTVLGNFYVDDCLKSIRDTEFGKRLVNELVNLLDDGGFNLTDWVSNDLSVLESVPEENRAKSVKLFDLNSREMPVERALGVRWSTEDDTLGVKVKTRETPCTRRGVLSLISSVYDPLGIVSPFILKGKLLLQSECRSGKGWDDRLGPEAEAAWQKWLQELPKLELYKVERCLLPSRFTLSDKMVLHHFSDASQVAYGVVSYLRSENHEGDVWCGFVMAKSRLAPLKTMTIPRLELSAAALAVKVDAMLRRELELQVTDSVFWTDSMIVLQYICSTSRRFQTFVANRVALIHDGSDPSQWRYVKSEQNPADDASRGLTADEMLNKERWAKGPEFLWGQESQWPEKPAGLPEPPVDDKEVKIKVQVFTTSVEDSEKAFDRLLRQFSSWFRLKRAVAWMMRFGAWLQSHKHVVLERRLSVNELQTAERAVLRYIQGKHFPAEVDSVVHGKSVCRQSSIQSLAPRLNAGLLVVGGRLQNAPISEESKYPAILPREDSVTKLIVRDIHEGEAVHGGREYVLGLLRCKYWIPQARPLISRVLRECVVCKRLRCMPGQQKMADLPFDRVTPGQRPFANCGVDCFGPYAVKRGRSTEKRYGCLFTCLCMRAIHIEKLHTMDADSFINALVRFMARRGVPDRIRSDNGTNFVGGERELRESMREWDKSDKVQGLLASKSIEWVFNPPAAPHMGGVWERQVKSVKRALSVILRDQVVDDERLDTLFCEAEAVVNGRPLTVVSDDPSDLKVLTPNDLLLLSGIPPRVPLGKFAKEDRYTRRWRHVQYLGDLFWKRWVKEYLPTLQLRQRWLNEQPNFRVDDVVLVMCENTPRRSWPLGRVSRVFPGKDGLVRSVELQTQDSVLVRPVDRLCLLEGASVSSDK